MPPIVKISREMVIEAGYRIADESGIDSVNCRSIAVLLGCSTQPVFSRFPHMEELKRAVFEYACGQIEQYILSENDNILERSLIVLADVARNHKNIYKLVYLSDYCSENSFMEDRMKYETNRIILKEIEERYSLSEEKAIDTFERISLLNHGIDTVIATTTMDYPDEQIISMVRHSLEEAVAKKA